MFPLTTTIAPVAISASALLAEPRYTLTVDLEPWEDTGLVAWVWLHEGEELVAQSMERADHVWDWFTPYLTQGATHVDGVPNPFEGGCEVRITSPYAEDPVLYRIEQISPQGVWE